MVTSLTLNKCMKQTRHNHQDLFTQMDLVGTNCLTLHQREEQRVYPVPTKKHIT